MSSKRSISGVVIQIALALYFFVTGLCLLGVGGSVSSGEIISSLSYLRLNTQLIRIIVGVVILLCGVMLVIRFFASFRVLDSILLLVTLVLWIAVTVLVILGDISSGVNLLNLLMDAARNCLIIGGILSISF